MGNRTFAAAFLTACACAAGLFFYRHVPPSALDGREGVGAELARLLNREPGAELGESNPEVVMVWVFRAEDCLSCQGWSWAFRRIQQKYAAKVRLYGVHVGDDASAVEQFFKRERLAASLLHLRPREYRRVFGSAALPALYVLKGETVVAVRAYQHRARDDDRLLEAVAGLLEGRNEDDHANPG